MSRFSILPFLLAATCALAQQSGNSGPPNQPAPSKPEQAQPSQTQSRQAQSAPNQPSPPSRDDDVSSSRDTRIDTTPPKDDAKNHPNSADAVSDLTPPPPSENSDVQEFHPWNPYKANKDIQVGDFYFRRRNYKGALDRYKEALYYKQNDAVATFRLAECYEKLGDKDEARKYFEEYLKILPEGPLAKEAHTALQKLAQAK
jgi:tetratricopeptide (TPR) repeat protein